MPRINESQAQLAIDDPLMTVRFSEFDEYTVSYLTFHLDGDATQAYSGLPDGRCQCPHWGVVKEGRIVLRYADHDEVMEAGDAYYAPPGHVPVVTAGTVLVEFSPTAALAQTMAAMSQVTV